MKFRWILLTLTAVFLLTGAAIIGQDTGTLTQWITLTMGLSVFGGGLVLATAWQWRQTPVSRNWLLVIIILGLTMRLLVLPAIRELSDDAARYHWDGKAVAHGVNPYNFAPDEAAVAHLWTDAIDERINHPWNRTCYPPVAAALFSTGYVMSPGSLRGLQIIFLCFEIFTWFVLARELERRRRSLSWLLLIIWSPLLICQGYLPGHVDILTLPFIALLISAVLDRQAARAGLWLALVCLIKPLPLLLLPAILRELGTRRSLRLLTVCGFVGILLYLPFREAGWKLFSSTWLMATDWSFNGSLGAALEQVLPMRQAHLVSSFFTAVGIMLTTWRGRDFLARAVGAHLVFVMFTPTLFPWYLIGTLPLMVLRPNPALLGLGMLVPMSDQIVIAHQLRGIWHEARWVRWVQYLSFYLLIILDRLGFPTQQPSRK